MGEMIKMMLPAILLAMDQAIHEFKNNPELAASVCAQFDVNGCVCHCTAQFYVCVCLRVCVGHV
jgi:hypothetical protein